MSKQKFCGNPTRSKLLSVKREKLVYMLKLFDKKPPNKKGTIRKDIKTLRIRSGLDIRLQKIVK